MAAINVTFEYGIVVRRKSLVERDVSYKDLLRVLEVQAPLDENERILSFGPHFGGDAQNELMKRIVELGLVYFDDFFELNMAHPEWLTFQTSSKEGPHG